MQKEMRERDARGEQLYAEVHAALERRALSASGIAALRECVRLLQVGRAGGDGN
ncbi:MULTISPECIES: hypothetical protein [Metallibacterium]|uniref:hypothetical protein n=1 Tax=Metallibacterium TaxID=1218803 RepID=UPI002638D661|nr:MULTISPECIES: hypothetical protein [Metallibacterium]MBW8076096.1 hypothetical protein [Metallibacterium scheffleri]